MSFFLLTFCIVIYSETELFLIVSLTYHYLECLFFLCPLLLLQYFFKFSNDCLLILEFEQSTDWSASGSHFLLMLLIRGWDKEFRKLEDFCWNGLVEKERKEKLGEGFWGKGFETGFKEWVLTDGIFILPFII